MTLQLAGPQGNEISLPNFRRFEAQYKLYRDSVPGHSAEEEWRMIFGKLPNEWRKQVIREQAKRRESRPWVRLTFPSGLTTEEALLAVETRLDGPMPNYKEYASGIIIETQTVQAQNRLLALHNARVEGFLLTATQHEYVMTGDEMFTFITKRLMTDEEFRLNCDMAGGPPTKPALAKTHVVEADDAKMHVVQASPRAPEKGKASAAKPYQGPRGTPSSPVRPQSPMSPRSTGNRDGFSKPQGQRGALVCRACKTAGRPFMHDYMKCEHSNKAWRESKGKNSRPRVASKERVQDPNCWTCQGAGRPCLHPYRECQHWQNRSKSRSKSPVSSSSGGGDSGAITDGSEYDDL